MYMSSLLMLLGLILAVDLFGAISGRIIANCYDYDTLANTILSCKPATDMSDNKMSSLTAIYNKITLDLRLVHNTTILYVIFSESKQTNVVFYFFASPFDDSIVLKKLRKFYIGRFRFFVFQQCFSIGRE